MKRYWKYIKQIEGQMYVEQARKLYHRYPQQTKYVLIGLAFVMLYTFFASCAIAVA